jgi:hypothetical protein
MNHRTIELLLIQLEESFSRSRSNIYSDIKKETHFIELHDLFLAIKISDYTNKGIQHYILLKDILNYIFTDLEYLDNSTLNIIPYEIVSCLGIALEDWVQKDNFIIVTSLSSKISQFYFETGASEEVFNNMNQILSTMYGLTIKHRLIKICLPKVLSRDYLSMVVLYHELGHFVDSELNITSKIYLKKFNKLECYNYEELIFYKHTSEYFADLFASQYIDNASNLYLNYIAYNQPDSNTHPSTFKRIEVVNNFLNGVNCEQQNMFNEVLKQSGSATFKIRYTKIELSKSDFLNLTPQKIISEQELHYIFKLGWDFWNSSDKNVLNNFESRQKYHVINNLIEKTISNYTIKRIWDGIS